MLGTCQHLVEIFRLWCTLKGCFAFLLFHPKDSVITIRIYCLCAVSHLVEKGKRMHNGKKLTYIVCAMDWPEMKYLRTGCKVDALIFHRSRIT